MNQYILGQISPLEPASTNRAEEIARQLEVLIAESAPEAGTSLGTKEDLRRSFKVSPGTMNEAARLLASRGVITTRRGAKGGVFVAATSVNIALRQSLLDLDRSAAHVEECWAVFKQLEPLVIIDATRRVTVDAVTELNRLVDEMAAATADQPIAAIRWNWRLYRKIAQMGSNTVLRTIYTMLLNVLEPRSEQLAAKYSAPERLSAIRRVVEAIASGDIERAASATA